MGTYMLYNRTLIYKARNRSFILISNCLSLQFLSCYSLLSLEGSSFNVQPNVWLNTSQIISAFENVSKNEWLETKLLMNITLTQC